MRWRSAALLVLLVACRRDAAPKGDPAVAAAREKARVPAIGWAVATNDAVKAGAEGAPPETVFHAASIAKLVVATTVLQLVDAGKVSLDAPVDVGLRLPPGVTLRALLTHTSGIRDHDLLDGRPDEALDTYLERYLAAPGAFGEPVYAYSNVGYTLAAHVVARVERRFYADVARQRVFEPLGMRSASWAGPGDRRHAVWPAADLHATAADLGRFAQMLLRDGERVLSPASTKLLFAGVGAQIHELGGARVVGHEGEDEHASTALFVDPARGVGAVVLANGDAFASGDKARAAALESLLVELLRRR